MSLHLLENILFSEDPLPSYHQASYTWHPTSMIEFFFSSILPPPHPARPPTPLTPHPTRPAADAPVQPHPTRTATPLHPTLPVTPPPHAARHPTPRGPPPHPPTRPAAKRPAASSSSAPVPTRRAALRLLACRTMRRAGRCSLHMCVCVCAEQCKRSTPFLHTPTNFLQPPPTPLLSPYSYQLSPTPPLFSPYPY